MFDMLLLLLLLSRFSRIQLCATPQTAAHQAPPSLGFSRQEHWSGLPFPPPMQESESEVTQSCPTPSNPMDCSLPGSSIHGIFQARVLEWDAFAFSASRGSPGLNPLVGDHFTCRSHHNSNGILCQYRSLQPHIWFPGAVRKERGLVQG